MASCASGPHTAICMASRLRSSRRYRTTPRRPASTGASFTAIERRAFPYPLYLAPLLVHDLDALLAVEDVARVFVEAWGVAFIVEEVFVRAHVVQRESRLVGHENVEAGIHDGGEGQVVGVDHQHGILAQ